MTDDSFRIPGPPLITAEAAQTIHLALGMMVALASGGAPDLAKRNINIYHYPFLLLSLHHPRQSSLSAVPLLLTLYPVMTAFLRFLGTAALLLLTTAPGARAAYVQTLEDATTVTESSSIWAVYPASADAATHSIMEHAASMMKGIFSVGVYDPQTVSMPWATTGVLILGDDKQRPLYELQLQEQAPQQAYEHVIQALSAALTDTLESRGNSQYEQQQQRQKNQPSAYVKLTAANFQELVLDNSAVVAVAFTAPWCGHCVRLEPEWKEAGRILASEDVVLGWVDATVEEQLAYAYQVQGYPTIKIFSGGSKSGTTPYDYPGERVAPALVEFLLTEVEKTGVPRPIPELTDFALLEESCGGANHLCVLAALPHILDSGAAGREAYLQSLSKVAKTFRKNFSFLWFEGGTAQTELEEALGLTFGFPALVALSLDRQALAVLHGAFRDTNIQTFLFGITTGRQAVLPLTAALNVATTTPWDGLDGQVDAEEDDFDLDAFLNDEM
jgi:protein disulfide-isomerase A6